MDCYSSCVTGAQLPRGQVLCTSRVSEVLLKKLYYLMCDFVKAECFHGPSCEANLEDLP